MQDWKRWWIVWWNKHQRSTQKTTAEQGNRSRWNHESGIWRKAGWTGWKCSWPYKPNEAIQLQADARPQNVYSQSKRETASAGNSGVWGQTGSRRNGRNTERHLWRTVSRLFLWVQTKQECPSSSKVHQSNHYDKEGQLSVGGGYQRILW